MENDVVCNSLSSSTNEDGANLIAKNKDKVEAHIIVLDILLEAFSPFLASKEDNYK